MCPPENSTTRIISNTSINDGLLRIKIYYSLQSIKKWILTQNQELKVKENQDTWKNKKLWERESCTISKILKKFNEKHNVFIKVQLKAEISKALIIRQKNGFHLHRHKNLKDSIVHENRLSSIRHTFVTSRSNIIIIIGSLMSGKLTPLDSITVLHSNILLPRVRVFRIICLAHCRTLSPEKDKKVEL